MPLVIPAPGRPGVCDGRLSLTSGVPITTTNVTGATTIYFTLRKGNVVYLYNGAVWVPYTFSELSVALGTLVSATNYDIFLWDNAGTLTLTIGPAWTSDSGRGTGAGTTEFVVVNGVELNAVAITDGPAVQRGLLVGSFRTTSTTTTADSLLLRGLWNRFNQVRRRLAFGDATFHSYTTNAWRYWNNTSASRAEWITGLVEHSVVAHIGASLDADGLVGVGLNATDASSPAVRAGSTSTEHRAGISWSAAPALGWNFLTACEYGVAADAFNEAYLEGEIIQ